MLAWNICHEHRALLLAEFALSNSSQGDVIARTLQAVNAPGFLDLHRSWHAALAHFAAQAGDLPLARTIAADVSIESLAAIDPPGRSERAADTTEVMARRLILFTELGLPLPDLAQAKQRLLRGAQSHILALAETIGLARAGRALPRSEVWGRASGAMHFVTAGRQGRDDDMLIGHLMGPVFEQVVALAFDACPLAAGDLAAKHDDLLTEHPHGFAFRHWL